MIQRFGGVALTMIVVGALATIGVLAKAAPSEPVTVMGEVSTRIITSTPIRLTQPADPQLGVLKPSASAASKGMYGPQIEWPIVPIHAALSRDGRLISYGTLMHDGVTQGGFIFDSWNPAAGIEAVAHSDTDSMGYDSFCNSLVTMVNGKILMVGGNSSMSTMIYDPETGATTMGKDLNKQRWYATTLALPNGKVLVLGGTETYDRHLVIGLPPGQATGSVPEIGTGTGTWKTLPGATSVAAFGAKHARWFYPRAFNAPNGQVVGFSGTQLWALDPTGKGKIKLTGKLPFDPGPSGSQVMFAPGKVLIASGGSHGPVDHVVASHRAVIVDFNGKKPKITNTGSLKYGRNWVNLTVLPNGQVLANGGTKIGTKAGDANSAKTAEIWNPATGKWRTVATAQRTRTYHSTALLLPSGVVFTGGSGAAPFTDGSASGPENNMNAELYYPAYLFTRAKDGTVKWASRPRISTISGSATYGGQLWLTVGGDAAKIKSASLITLPSVTHSQGTDQRRVALTVKQRGKQVVLSLSKSEKQLPPGDYELAITNSKGVPSPAQIITIKRKGPGLVTLAVQKPTAGATSVGSTPTTMVSSGPEASNAPSETGTPSEDIVQPSAPATSMEEMSMSSPDLRDTVESLIRRKSH